MTSSLPGAVSKLLTKPNPFAKKGQKSLFETLSSLPNDGVGSRVAQTRWVKQGISGSFWEVTKVKLKHEGQHGKAWGRLYWGGKPAETIKGRAPEHERLIRGGLKYGWTTLQLQNPPNSDSGQHSVPPNPSQPASSD